jgi:hypothetical protein
MNTPNTFSVAQEKSRNRVSGSQVIILIVVAVLAASQLMQVRRATATGPDMLTLTDMLQNGQGEAALQLVVAAAAELGSWSAAPGDELTYDPYMSRKIRGSSLDYDEFPDCGNPKVASDEQACRAQFQMLEHQVRFGPSFFSTPEDGGGATPRPAFDDLLSTYIEEVGHSWQEYLYETEGRGSGARTRQTTLAESERWSFGREYQVKRYILSLDGTLVNLSDQQRVSLTTQICEGYANPLGHDVPEYGAPAGWPHPEGWPVTAPTPDELVAFCAGA